jgi:hypothetical protein
MYFTSDSMLPENQQPLIITVAPFGPQWLPSDYPEDIPLTWEQQTQKRSIATTPARPCCTSTSRIRKPVTAQRISTSSTSRLRA